MFIWELSFADFGTLVPGALDILYTADHWIWVVYQLLYSDRGHMDGFQKSLRHLLRSLNLEAGREEATGRAKVKVVAPGLSQSSLPGPRAPLYFLLEIFCVYKNESK